MYPRWIFTLIFFLEVGTSFCGDCIQGESWLKNCEKCTCLTNGQNKCDSKAADCKPEICLKLVSTVDKERRCHCGANDVSICVPMRYQKELNGAPCSGKSYYYDTCTNCTCDSNTLKCEEIPKCSSTIGGFCNVGEEHFEDCYKCTCTTTRFRKCAIVDDCASNKKKPGRCFIARNVLPPQKNRSCVWVRNQVCHSDYQCPGKKKCCPVVDCFYRCVDPISQ